MSRSTSQPGILGTVSCRKENCESARTVFVLRTAERGMVKRTSSSSMSVTATRSPVSDARKGRKATVEAR